MNSWRGSHLSKQGKHVLTYSKSLTFAQCFQAIVSSGRIQVPFDLTIARRMHGGQFTNEHTEILT
ncbi:hypothetical protein ACVI55_004443 [Sinorhizobium medicae]